jgi:hypothetical chaperone protein
MNSNQSIYRSCGLDFGTSNSSIGYCVSAADPRPSLTQFDGKGYMPSAIFFDHDILEPMFGNQAIERYIDCQEGRMIWSPKNALGTGLMAEKTQIRNTAISFKEIIGLIVKNLKRQCESQSQCDIVNVVSGRPVFFNDDDQSLDKLAEDSLREILQQAGFKNIEFEYEPIAAAIHYEKGIAKEEIAFIVDMGGGTSDFTVAKLEPAKARASDDRKKRILSVGGIHIAGTDFDKQLSLATVMPELGLGSQYKSLEGKWLPVPPSIYHDLATWHKIGFSYSNQNVSYAKGKVYSSDTPEKFERLLHTLRFRYGHYLARLVEKTKIELSEHANSVLKAPDIKPEVEVQVSKAEFENAIVLHVERIQHTINSTLQKAGILPHQIDAIFMTGGSSLIPAVRKSIIASMPQARLIEGDKFGSVAMGLTESAIEKFS